MAQSDALSFVFYESFRDAIEKLPDDNDRNEAYRALIFFGLDGTFPEKMSPVVDALMTAFATQIAAQRKKRRKKSEDGTKGGTKKAENAKKNESKNDVKNKVTSKPALANGNGNGKGNDNGKGEGNNAAQGSGKRENKTAYGRYQNVFLSLSDVRSLKKDFPNDYWDRIENLSEYKQSSNKTYKDDAATIRLWARRETQEEKKREVKKEQEKFKGMDADDIADTKAREKMLDDSWEDALDEIWDAAEKKDKDKNDD